MHRMTRRVGKSLGHEREMAGGALVAGHGQDEGTTRDRGVLHAAAVAETLLLNTGRKKSSEDKLATRGVGACETLALRVEVASHTALLTPLLEA